MEKFVKCFFCSIFIGIVHVLNVHYEPTTGQYCLQLFRRIRLIWNIDMTSSTLYFGNQQDCSSETMATWMIFRDRVRGNSPHTFRMFNNSNELIIADFETIWPHIGTGSQTIEKISINYLLMPCQMPKQKLINWSWRLHLRMHSSENISIYWFCNQILLLIY